MATGAYPAATILVTAVMLEFNRRILFAISLGLHLAIAVALAIVPAFAERLPLFERLQFLSRVVGWRDVADAVREKLGADHYGAVLVDTREIAAELLYYMRDSTVPLYVWPAGPVPTDQYEMTRAYGQGAPEPVLFVSLKRCPANLKNSFGEVVQLGTETKILVETKTRILHFCRLSGYKGR